MLTLALVLAATAARTETVRVDGVDVDVRTPAGAVRGEVLVLPGWDSTRAEWCARGRLCDEADARGLRLVMPETGKSVYAGAVFAETRAPYRTALTRPQLVDVIRRLQRERGLLADPARTFVLGRSTGGRGAVLLALDHPAWFRAAAALSGDFDPAATPADALMVGAYGPFAAHPERWHGVDNPQERAAELAVPLYLAHGKKDCVVPAAQTIAFAAATHAVLHVDDDGGHDHAFWSSELPRVFAFFDDPPGPVAPAVEGSSKPGAATAAAAPRSAAPPSTTKAPEPRATSSGADPLDVEDRATDQAPVQDFLHALLQFPSILFAGFLALSLLYWLLVIIGAADLNPFDGAEHAIKGGIEGAAHAVAPDGVAEAVEASALTEALAFLGLTKVPVTVSFSVFSLFSWFIAMVTRQALDGHIPGLASGAAATAAAVVGGFAVTSLVVKPMSGIFTESTRVGKEGLVGRTVKVTSELADHERGTGDIDDGAGGITIAIRTAPGVSLQRGDEAIVIEHDDNAGTYTVVPQRSVVPSDRDVLATPVAAPAEVVVAARKPGST